MRETITSQVILPPRFHYSQVVKAGPYYHCSGMVAIDNETGELRGEGPGEQTAVILENLALLMKELALGWEDLVFARIYSSQFDRFQEINMAWEQAFKNITPPGRSAVGVSALPLGAAVEIEFTFYKE